MKIFFKIVRILNQICEFLTVCAMISLTVIIILQIVTRSLHISIAWLEELARYMMIYLCFLGSAVCVRKMQLIKIDVFQEIVPGRIKRVLIESANLLSIIFLLFAIYSCIQYLPIGLNSSASSMKNIRMFWFYLAMPIGLCMMLINQIAVTFERWKGVKK